MSTLFIRLLLLVPLVALLTCSQDYNPFAHSENARVEVLWEESGFADGDSLAIFSTKELVVAPLVAQQLDSFSIHAVSNRLFSDTTITTIAAQNYHFALSYADTGRVSIMVSFFRKGSAPVRQTYSFFRYSPLHQSDISATIESPVTLTTPPVADSVEYCWEFGDGTSVLRDTVRSVYPRASKLLSAYGSIPGKLWVSGGQGVVSPAVPFWVTLNDFSAPSIACLNAGIDGDELRTAQSELAFSVAVNDRGGLRQVSINDEHFPPKATKVYTVLLKNLDNAPGRQTTVRVDAVDKADNSATMTFTVIFDPNAGLAGATQIRIANSVDSVPDTWTHFPVLGSVLDFGRDTVLVGARVNESGGDSLVKVALVNGRGGFGIQVKLDSTWNNVQLEARDLDNTVLATTSVVILRDPNFSESAPPRLFDITANGTVADSGKMVFVEADTCVVEARAFDQSGIRSVIVNGQDATVVSDMPNQWRRVVSGITHERGSEVRIIAIDSTGKQSTYSFLVQKNRPPIMRDQQGLPLRVFVGVPVSFDVVVTDADGDVLSAWLTRPLESMQLRPLSGSGRWTLDYLPRTEDIGFRTVGFNFWDGYEEVVFNWAFVVAADSSRLVTFASRAEIFPPALVAGRDELLAMLRVVPGSGRYPLRFLVSLEPQGVSVFDQQVFADSVLVRWAPAESDTGHYRLRAQVVDENGDRDTLLRELAIVRPNRCPCSLSVSAPVPRSALGEFDLSGTTGLVPFSFTISDCDDPATERYLVMLTRAGARSEMFFDSAVTFVVDVSRSPHVWRDTLIVTVADSTGTHDTAVVAMLMRQPVAAPDSDFVWPSRLVAGSAYQIDIPFAGYGNAVAVSLTSAPGGMISEPAAADSQLWRISWTPTVGDAAAHVVSMALHGPYGDSTHHWQFTVLPDSASLLHIAGGGGTKSSYVQAAASYSSTIAIHSGSGLPPYRVRICENNGSCLVDTTIPGDTLAYTLPPRGSVGDLLTYRVLVCDTRGDCDSMLNRVTVVEPNVYPCSLSIFSLGGLTMLGSELDLTGLSSPATISFIITDSDHFSTELYRVVVAQSGSSREMVIDKAGVFTVTVAPSRERVRDTLRVSVTDLTGHTSSVLLPLRYLGQPQYPCSLVVVPPDGVTLHDGVYDASGFSDSVTFAVHITDLDPSIIESYTVLITRDNVTSEVNLDSARSLAVTVTNRQASSIDSVWLSVTDASGFSATYMLRVSFDGDWVRKQVTINTSSGAGGAAVASNQTAFPLLIRLTSADLDFSAFSATPPQILCTRGAVALPLEIESWDPVGRTAAIWVLVDTVYGNRSAQHLELTVNRFLAYVAAGPGDVFSSGNGFAAVWHFNDAINGPNTDATDNATTLLPKGGMISDPPFTEGYIGSGPQFNGTDEWLETATKPASLMFSTAFSLSVWCYQSTFTAGGKGSLIARQHGTTWADSYDLVLFGSNLSFAHGPGAVLLDGPAIAQQSWVHLAGTKNGSVVRLYINGNEVAQSSEAPSSVTMESGKVTTVGGQYNSSSVSQFFAGKLDEARVESVSRSADWFKLCYETQKAAPSAVIVQ